MDMRDKEMKRLVIIVWAVLALFVLSLLCGCTRKVYVPVESKALHSDTVWQTRLRVDSVTLRDSVIVLQRGDTVEITRFRDRYKVRNRVDTVYRSAVDSVTLRVPYPVERIKEVDRPLAWWQRVLIWCGGVFLLAAAAYAFRKFRH